MVGKKLYLVKENKVKKNKIRLALWGRIGYIFPYRDVAQVVARLTGGQEAAGSSPVIPRQKEFFPFGENSFCMNSYEKGVVCEGIIAKERCPVRCTR